jgi:hypothetical protein
MKRINPVVFTLIFMWLGWFVVLYGIQAVTPMRLNLERPV